MNLNGTETSIMILSSVITYPEYEDRPPVQVALIADDPGYGTAYQVWTHTAGHYPQQEDSFLYDAKAATAAYWETVSRLHRA